MIDDVHLQAADTAIPFGPFAHLAQRDWARVDQPNHLGPFQARVSIGFLRQHGEGFRENAHRTTCIRTRERRARNVAHPQMIVLMGVCLKGRFDGAQACDPAQLSAHHRHEMIPTFERFVVRIAVMALDDFPKLPSINRFEEPPQRCYSRIACPALFCVSTTRKYPVHAGFAGHALRHSESFPGQPCTARGSIEAEGLRLLVYACDALVLGSGAAGWRAAVELKRYGIDVVVATQNCGTSACSGSDKQTLHTAATGRHGDDFIALAAALGAGGAMDEDTAYVEAVGSLRALSSLQYLGLPIPLDRLGAVLRYQTDHDEAGRATSCGPRTSRLMVKVLAEESARLGVPVLNRCVGAKILATDDKPKRVTGLLAFHAADRTADNPLGLVVIRCADLVTAAGGPGELYRDSVYPKHCFGALGLALEAGVEAVNLTESQFAIGTPRDGFRWNLSGTYAQCLPYIHSVDTDGIERNFLGDYYRTTQELASNIFRKGYQWPFHASRMLDFGSSLVDVAIFRETRMGRKVLMDFNRNPEPVPGGAPLHLA